MSRLGFCIVGFFSSVAGAGFLFLGVKFLNGSQAELYAALTLGAVLGSIAGWTCLRPKREKHEFRVASHSHTHS